MEKLNWGSLLFPLIGGGAMGAVLTALFSAIRNRKQPIGYRIEVDSLFAPLKDDSSLNVKVTLSKGGSDFHFSNLFLLQVVIVNKGNVDFSEFDFGLTFGRNDQAIYVDAKQPDRHHIIESKTAVGPANPKREIDFILCPFNRRDAYTLNIFATGALPSNLDEIKISSTKSVRFVSMPTVSELVAQTAKGFSAKIGPARITIDPW